MKIRNKCVEENEGSPEGRREEGLSTGSGTEHSDPAIGNHMIRQIAGSSGSGSSVSGRGSAGGKIGSGENAIAGMSMVILYVKDPMTSLEFYGDRLGLPVKESSPGWLELDLQGVTLALTTNPSLPTVRDPTRPWVVLRTDDIFRTYRTLQSRGVRFHSPPMRVFGDEITSGYSADLEDPDGNRLSILGTVPTKDIPR